MRWGMVVVAVIVISAFAAPEPAYAWGPATHAGLATEVLAHLALLPAGLAALLSRRRLAYTYGNIAADVVFAKRLSRVKQFCHHWSTGFRLLDDAADESSKAFAWGYLSHLAADTVAHGKYVPRQIVLSNLSLNFGHFYWELRAEAMADERSVQCLARVLDHDHSQHHHTLRRHMTGTFLTFGWNRMVFDGVNALALQPGLRRTMDACNRRSQSYLSPLLLEGYRTECVDRIISLLSEGTASPLLRDDPSGTSALMRTKVQQRDRRRLERRGLPMAQRLYEASKSLAPARHTGLTAARAAAVLLDGSGEMDEHTKGDTDVRD